MLTARLNEPPRVVGPLLLLICSYRGWAGNFRPFSFTTTFPALGRAGKILDRLALLSLRRFIARNRDFSANPRDLAYQAGLAREFLALGAPGDVICVIDAAYEGQPGIHEFEAIGAVEIRPAAEFARGAERFTTVGLIYPDALGLGWAGLETQLVAVPTPNIVLVNGRRRLLTLDAEARRALRWRRFLANTRLMELVFASATVPIAAACAAVDMLRGRK